MVQPLLTTSGGFLFYTGDFGGIFDPRGPLSLYLYGNGSEKNTGTTTFDRCAPPSLQEYDADPAPWQKQRRECPETYMRAIPMGTAIQVDDIYWSYDFENGDRYKIAAHFVDPRLGRDEFELSQYYFITAQQSPDGHMHLKPQYFKAQHP
ncbi:MAG TPA: hypothetical protein VFV77_09140 [Gammaproteobacteria bacterium]|nr:hypothetical protein [Gammaproteobacteria bacterium]